jgi:hypothetical protein
MYGTLKAKIFLADFPSSWTSNFTCSISSILDIFFSE